ncbi:MAG: MBL fold metallo-hydrolase [Gammaproteobacteria bacterium]|nr:MBL fold metallo-hydrolase [Gammaproteobacteria bacterium]
MTETQAKTIVDRPESVVEYPFDDYPAEGSVTEVYPNIYWLSTPLPFRLRSINLWLLKDGDGWAIVDCGYKREDVQQQWKQIWRTILGDHPVKQIIVTHFHPDHMGNSKWLSDEWGIKPQMSETEWEFANLAVKDENTDNLDELGAFYAQNGLDGERIERIRQEFILYSKGCGIPSSYDRLVDRQRIHIDGNQWQVLIGYGHSPEHVCLYCAEIGVMISGDQILPEITPNVSVWPRGADENPLQGFIQTMQRFKPILRKDTLVLPSHRRPFIGVHTRFDELEHHHHDRLDKVMSSVGSGITAGELLGHLFPVNLDGHQIVFAMNEALAHLNYLMYEGRLQRVNSRNDVVVWRRI